MTAPSGPISIRNISTMAGMDIASAAPERFTRRAFGATSERASGIVAEDAVRSTKGHL